MTYRFTHDPESGAIYVRLREGRYHETIPLAKPGFGAGVDVDDEGNVLGVEFLSFEEFAEVVAAHGGRLELPEHLALRAEESATFRWSSGPERGSHRYDPEDVRRAISSLEPRQQEVVRLHYMEGLGYSEVAERLGISVAAAYRLHHKAFQHLRGALAERESGTMDDASLEAFLSTL